MRIIDKNHDFYDYLQDPTDDTLVFDRRGSFQLEKEDVCHALRMFDVRRGTPKNFGFMELQCGGTFWMFLINVTKTAKSLCEDVPVDYSLELLATWRDYSKPNKLLDVNLVSMPYARWDYRKKTWELDRKDMTPENIRIHFEQGRNMKCIGSYTTTIQTKKGWERVTYTIPILKATGIGNVVDPLDVFCGIEEYFSREKTAAERTEAIGTTNNDKIVMHGFDTKTSFRGKNA